MVRRAHELNTPQLVAEGLSFPDNSYSYFSVDKMQVKIETVKKSEDGSGIIVRLYETGGTVSSCHLVNNLEWDQVWETNLIEDKLVQINSIENKVALPLMK